MNLELNLRKIETKNCIARSSNTRDNERNNICRKLFAIEI